MIFLQQMQKTDRLHHIKPLCGLASVRFVLLTDSQNDCKQSI